MNSSTGTGHDRRPKQLRASLAGCLALLMLLARPPQTECSDAQTPASQAGNQTQQLPTVIVRGFLVS